MTLVNKLGQDPNVKDRVTFFAAIDRDLKETLVERAYKTRKSVACIVEETLEMGFLKNQQYNALKAYARKNDKELPEVIHEAIKAYLKVNK